MKNKKAGKDNKEEVQMSNIKFQLKSQYIISNFEFCYLDFSNNPRPSQMNGIDLAFGYWNLSLDQQFFPPSLSFLGYGV